MGWTAPDGIIRAKLVVSIRNQQRGPSMAKISMIGLDLAKNVFQIHGIDAELFCDVSCGEGRWRSFSLNCRRRS
jgi:hypothetical protein